MIIPIIKIVAFYEMQIINNKQYQAPKVQWVFRFILALTVMYLFLATPALAFQAGDRVQTTENLKIRSCASLSTSCTWLDTAPSGSIGSILYGPFTADGYTWWYINWDNSSLPDGYSVDDYLTATNDPPNSFSKSSPADGTGVTSYAVTFDWPSVSDPDGDTVTYNLVVNDASGNPVSACTANGLTSSRRSCTLPQQANKDYYWQVWAVDSENNSREATGGFWHLWTDTQSINSPPNSLSKSSPADGTGVTSYAVTFDWPSVSDPDGDAVSYNLEVKDASDNPVSGCTANGLTSSGHNCTLPQQANQHYFWQVWAIDSHGDDTEATGPFWHLWTDTQTNTSMPVDAWRNVVRVPDARITQLFGEKYISPNSGNFWTHTGLDIADGSCGETPVYPVMDGIVVKVTEEGDGNFIGNGIIIDHENGFYSLYGHMTNKSGLAEGVSRVYTNTSPPLGTIDKTGTGACHLHFEIRDFPQVLHTQDTDGNIYENGYPLVGQDLEFLLEHWKDPVTPSIGQFKPGGVTPPGFSASTHVEGWDVSTNIYSQRFNEAYAFYRDKKYTSRNLGVPYDNGDGEYVHCWSAPGDNPDCIDGVWIQDLKRTLPTYQFEPDGQTSLILNSAGNEVFLLKEGFWGFYLNHDGFQNLGAPKTEEDAHTGSPNFDSNAVVQQFDNGALYYHPDPAYDRTPPSSDHITVLDADLVTPISATQGWHIEGQNGEKINLYQNGNFLCQTPCDGIYSVDGWRYTITAPEVNITNIQIIQGIPFASSTNSADTVSALITNAVSALIANTVSPLMAGAVLSYGDPLLHDEHNFSFTALSDGGRVVLETADDDNDGVVNGVDLDALDPTICQDVDSDSCDDCSVGTDGFGPLPDNDPLNDGVDTDADGQCNAGDPDDDNDGMSDVDEVTNNLDPLDPDSDGDGIFDGIDRFPKLASNLCIEPDTLLENQMVTGQVTCAATSSISVESTVSVEDTGELELISPTVGLRPGFSVHGKLSVINIEPAPNSSSTTVLQPGPGEGKDVRIRSIVDTTPRNDHKLRVGGWGDEYYSLIEFDISTLPASVQSAEIEFYSYHDGHTYRTDMFLDRIDSAWSEATIWSTRPSSTYLKTIPAPVLNSTYTIDITDLYNSWQTGTPNYGIQLRPCSTLDAMNAFYSSDYVDVPSLRPKLIIQP